MLNTLIGWAERHAEVIYLSVFFVVAIVVVCMAVLCVFAVTHIVKSGRRTDKESKARGKLGPIEGV